MATDESWMTLPERLLIISNTACVVLGVLSLICLVLGMVRKKHRNYFIGWIIVLIVCAAIIFFSMIVRTLFAGAMVSG